MNPQLIKNFEAGAAITKHRIVKPGADDDHVLVAAANTDLLIGIADLLGAAAAEDRIDVILAGIADVEFGGTVTRGQSVTADSSGKAVRAKGKEGIKTAVVAGAGAATNITVTGIATEDEIISVIKFVGSGTDVTDVADVTSEASITAADTIQLTGASTSTELLVVYRDMSTTIRSVGIALVSAVSGDIGKVLVVPGEM